MTNKTDVEILKNAPKGATHYHCGFKKYYRFKECETTAEMYLMDKWEPYPLYPSIISLADIKALVAKDKRIADLQSKLHQSELKTISLESELSTAIAWRKIAFDEVVGLKKTIDEKDSKS